jgi:hypothetical protein
MEAGLEGRLILVIPKIPHNLTWLFFHSQADLLDACRMLSCCLLPIILTRPQLRRDIIGPEPNTLMAHRDAIVTWLALVARYA